VFWFGSPGKFEGAVLRRWGSLHDFIGLMRLWDGKERYGIRSLDLFDVGLTVFRGCSGG